VGLQRNAKVRGFRPGKVPRDVVKRLYGASVTQDVCGRLAEESLEKLLAERAIQPLSKPQVQLQPLVDESPMQFKARFEVKPEIGDIKWEGLQIERLNINVTNEQIDRELAAIQKQHAPVVVPEPLRPAKKGDRVTIDIALFADGQQELNSDGMTATIGEGLLPEIDSLLDGLEVGAEKQTTTTLPATYPLKKFQGKAVTFKVKLLEVKELQMPAIDDELAKDAGFDSLDALKTDVRNKLEKAQKDYSEQQLVIGMVAALVNANPVEAPPSLVEQQAQMTFGELKRQREAMGQTLELTDQVRQNLLVDSVAKVRAGLLMAELAMRNNIKVADQDLEKAMQEIADDSGKNIARVRADYRDANRRQMLIGMVLEDKVLDLLQSKAQIKDVDTLSSPSPNSL
jgi:trigger factor